MVFGSLKGQVSIEFVLIIVLMLMFIQTVIEPSVSGASNALEDIRQAGEIKAASQKLADSVDELALAPDGAVKTIFLFVPKSSTITCDAANKQIKYDTNLSSEATACQPPKETIIPADNDPKKCTYAIKTIAATLSCTTTTFDGLTKGNTFEVKLSKTAGVVSVS